MYFSNSPIEPLTSIMASTTALDWYLMVGSQTLKRRSSDLISWNLASPLAALRFMFSMKRTIMENMKRNAAKGEARFQDIKSEDLRFKVWKPTIRYQSNAVVIAMMDVSGSMGEFEKYIARSFYFWMVRFLRTKYNNVQIVFISHHTEAKEVTEEEFFHKGESGGTQVSSAYELALDIIKERYNPDDWNIYPFHFSDGDNLPWDNDRCVQLVTKLMELCNIFDYAGIREGHYRSPSTLMSAYNKITDKKFISVTISDKKEVYPALRKFFAQPDSAPTR